jgi:hypothetical protein
MKAGILSIDRRLLKDLLRLPESSEIVDVSCDRDIMGGLLKIIVSDPSLTEVPEGNLIPIVEVFYFNTEFQSYLR